MVTRVNKDTPKEKVALLKAYILQFVYPDGNGWAIINATSVSQAQSIFYNQTKYQDTKITDIKESKWYGNNMQLVYEGAVTTYANLDLRLDLDKLINNNGAYETLGEFLAEYINIKAYCTKEELKSEIEEALKDIDIDIDLDNYYNKSETDTKIQEELAKIPKPSVEIGQDGYWYINGSKTNTLAQGPQGQRGLQGPQGQQGPKGSDGLTPTVNIQEVSGVPYWFINGSNSGVTAQGPAGKDGKDGKDGEDGVTPNMENYYTKGEIDEMLDDLPGGSGDDPDLTDLEAAVTALQGNVTGLQEDVDALSHSAQPIPIGIGSFQSAFDYSENNTDVMFPWVLRDTDDDGDVVRKLIYHIGNRQFIDALGSDIIGKLDGLTIVTSDGCNITLNGSPNTLLKGMNNRSISSSSITISWGDSNLSKVLSLDFGGKAYNSSLRFLSNLQSVRRLKITESYNQKFGRYSEPVNSATNLVSAELIAGTNLNNCLVTTCLEWFANCYNLRNLDLSQAFIKPTSIAYLFYYCGLHVYDLRTFDMRSLSSTASQICMFTGSAINTLIVGDNFVPNIACSQWWKYAEKDFTLVIIHNGEIQEQMLSGGKVSWMYRDNTFMFKTIKVPYGTTTVTVNGNELTKTYKQMYIDMWHLPETDVTYVEYEEGEY